ncbi:hypothetical protein [Lysinibacillus antri]|uniref:Uncharacterized protein n=1 Tax=Lysinibacillus antri TaxID=2498145 RepID=A0A432L9P4_9BACI|nr:hypothetical protein [Lysinibacillus antri]RUL49561.1 hypothetical protein EK386_14815 [Lysinibacillus antri]
MLADQIRSLTALNLLSMKWSTTMNTLYSIEALKMDTLIPIILKRVAYRKTTNEGKEETQ